MTPEQQVTEAAGKAAAARRELEASIRDARAAGLSLRAIAALAGMSHEQVRRVCS